MTDYDPKSIPILDDIIEDDNNGSDQISPDITENEGGQEDSSPDLFAAAPADIAATDISEITITTMAIDVESAQPGIADIERFIDTDGNTDIFEAETSASSLLDYHSEDLAEDVGEPVLDRQQREIQHETVPLTETQHEGIQPYALNADASTNKTDASNKAAEPLQPVALDTLADGIVKQLMPELEQKLRFLVQQALEDKLPSEIIERSHTDD